MSTLDEAGKLGLAPEPIIQFLLANWDRPVAICDRRFYEWQFVAPPHQDGLDRCVISLNADGEIDGFLGMNRFRFLLDGKPVDAGVGTTFIINEQARSRGVAKKMMDHLFANYDVLLGAGITDMVLPLYLRIGFKYLRAIPRYVRVVDPDAVLPVSEVTVLGRKLVNQFRRTRVATAYDAGEIDLAGATFDYPDFGRDYNQVERSAEYLAWRYADHPVFDYRAYRVTRGQASALLVVRVDQAEGLRVVHVMDLIGDHDVFPCAIDYVDELCREHGAALADFYCVSGHIGRYFWAQDWFSTLDDIYVQVPHLFHPIDLRSPATSSLILYNKHPESSYLDRSRMYVTKQDCDLDRPTQEFFDVPA